MFIQGPYLEQTQQQQLSYIIDPRSLELLQMIFYYIMDAEEEKNDEIELKQQKIVAMLKVTKKNHPLFKPLKKLKNALESIRHQKVSMSPTKTVLLFHFGLGNDLDFEFIKKSGTPGLLSDKNPVLPGKSYCYLNFESKAEAEQYVLQNYLPIIEQIPARYAQIEYQNLTRVMICFFCSHQSTGALDQFTQLESTPLHYAPGTIPGISLIQDFVSKQDQLQLLQAIDKCEWSKLNNRRVQHYGYEFKYGKNLIERDEKYDHPMPEFIHPILKRLEKLDILRGFNFDQMTINDYFSGDGIPSHFDTHSPFEEQFVAISLLSGLVMDWRKYDGTEKQVYLPARSLIVFAGEGRYAWTHGISCRKVDKIQGELRHRSRRISLTLRKIKFDPCQCSYYFYCDSQGYDQNTMKKNNPLLSKYLAKQVDSITLNGKGQQQLYDQFVLKAYNGCGFDFHNRAIDLVQKLISACLNEGSQCPALINILDIGCGNGEYLQMLGSSKFANFYHYIGIQICQSMKQFEDKIHMDGLSLALRENAFDLVLCIAVLHHMTNPAQRVAMLRQIHKVMTDQGTAIVSVLGYEQKAAIYDNQDILLDYCVSLSKMDKQQLDRLAQNSNGRVQKKGVVFQRYYHLFKEDEILALCQQANLKVLTLSKDKENIVMQVCRSKL